MIRWHKSDLKNRMYIVIEDGKKISMPRYYKNKIYHDEERRAIAYWAERENEKLQARLEATGNILSSRDQAEKDKAAFEKMYHLATAGRDAI